MAAKTKMPFPIEETSCLSTVTEADRTRWSMAIGDQDSINRTAVEYLAFHVEYVGNRKRDTGRACKMNLKRYLN